MQKELILGPPGTGKTTTLINIVSDLLDQGARPDEIAFVSFTRKAASEAIDRALEKFDLPRKAFCHFGTIHSTAFRALGLSQDDVIQPRHWDEISRCLKIPMHFESLADGLSESSMFSHHLQRAKAECMTAHDHYLRIGKTPADRRFHFGSTDQNWGLTGFVRMDEFINQYKHDHGIVDFSDMLEMGAQSAAPLDVRYAIIDEAQDLSRLQWKFCKHIFSNCEKVWIAGDDDQAVFSWAGADLNTFLKMQAERRVLDYSWRLPRVIWEFANGIISNVRDRYEKSWSPRDEEGEFHLVDDLSECPLDNGETWFLLTRTRAQQQGMAHYLRKRGLIYSRNGMRSINGEHLALARSWTNLLKGNRISANSVQMLYAHLFGYHLAPDARQKVQFLEPDTKLGIAELRREYGLLIERGTWFEVLDIARDHHEYYRRVKENMGFAALESEPKIKIATMHGVKGGEADNVFFSNSMGRRPFRAFKNGYTYDDEHRIFYVAATRAKKRLYLQPAGQTVFPLPKIN